MPSLRKKVSSYFRQLSFYNEPKEKRGNVNENAFVTKYLQGQIKVKDGPQIFYGKNPTDLPNHDVGLYETGAETIVACFTGPDGGLTAVKKSEKHLSIADNDIDFIDTPHEEEEQEPAGARSSNSGAESSPRPPIGRPVDNSTMVIRVGGQEYLVTNRHRAEETPSLDSLDDLGVKVETTRKLDLDNNNGERVPCKNGDENVKATNRVKVKEGSSLKVKPETSFKAKPLTVHTPREKKREALNREQKSGKSQQKRRGKLVKVTTLHGSSSGSSVTGRLPSEWDRKSDLAFGLSDSLYDRNQVTKVKNGDPIADCFGIVARRDSSILAVADGVNWGEKASIAAKSAVHGCLRYLNQTLFGEASLFDTPTKGAEPTNVPAHRRISTTREVFVSLLRAFSCAHDLILENQGMLTTLTVAIVLPLRPKSVRSGRGQQVGVTEQDGDYVCCVCNVGDTLAYVYSQKYGVRELTKGSHDVSMNRDMRDALGALGPVDGINPELSNLTLSMTTLSRGDIVLVASDGLTDNFDPNVCRFTANVRDGLKKTVPQKPPRKHKGQGQPVQGQGQRSEPCNSTAEIDNPLVAQFLKDNSLTSDVGGARGVPARPKVHVHSAKVGQIPPRPQQMTPPANAHRSRPNFLRSKTCVEMRRADTESLILRNEDGVPYVTPTQRYELSLLLMEDVLKRGLSGQETQCSFAKKLCESLISFTLSITAAKRRTLEESDLYFDNIDGVMVEVSQQEKKLRRRRGLDKVQHLPGKLDHVTVVAYNVGYHAENN